MGKRTCRIDLYKLFFYIKNKIFKRENCLKKPERWTRVFPPPFCAMEGILPAHFNLSLHSNNLVTRVNKTGNSFFYHEEGGRFSLRHSLPVYSISHPEWCRTLNGSMAQRFSFFSPGKFPEGLPPQDNMRQILSTPPNALQITVPRPGRSSRHCGKPAK